MARIHYGGKKGHIFAEREKRWKQAEKRRKRIGKSKRTPEPTYQDKDFLLNILFYGREDWYNSLSKRLGLPDHIYHSNFRKIYDRIHSINAIIVDCIQGENLIMPFLKYIKKEGLEARVYLSYEKGTNIEEFTEYADKWYPYSKTDKMGKELTKLRMSFGKM